MCRTQKKQATMTRATDTHAPTRTRRKKRGGRCRGRRESRYLKYLFTPTIFYQKVKLWKP